MTSSEKELIQKHGYTLKEIAKAVKLDYNSYRKSTSRERYSDILMYAIRKERERIMEMTLRQVFDNQ